MDIKLIESWGGAPAGTSLSLPEKVAENLIERHIAELSAPKKGAAKSGGKDDKK